jgi:hypothetical protein
MANKMAANPGGGPRWIARFVFVEDVMVSI